MTIPLLTIIVPTFNRCTSLELLLRNLREEISPLGKAVAVFVSDNASTDSTHNIIERIRKYWPELLVYRQSSNIGPDKNFSYCVSQVKSRWFWFISDDDLPKRGVVAQIIEILQQYKPALLYMESEWIYPIMSSDQGEPISQLKVVSIRPEEFAEKVHIWVTFISGMIVDKDRLQEVLQEQPINRFDGTFLVQLGWVLPLLKTTGSFLLVTSRCILATKDNSGGYELLTVFGVNFPRIVNESFGAGSILSRSMIGSAINKYLPALVWRARRISDESKSVRENPWPKMQKEIGSYWLYWFLLVPLGRSPFWIAKIVYYAWRVINKIRREWVK